MGGPKTRRTSALATSTREVEELAATDDRRRRRYYRLTSLGSEVLIAEAGRLVRLADAARARNLVPDAGEAS
jgi:DNA-binding PadR family transcriptional regulator